MLCLALSLGLLVLTRGLPQSVLVPVGPAFYPRIVLIAMAALSAILITSDVLVQRRARGGEVRAPKAGPSPAYGLVLLVFAFFGGYVILLPEIGYRLATFLFVAALQVLLSTPKTPSQWLRLCAIALGTTIVTYFTFELYLAVLLPRGELTGF
ncbi:MAG: tripartite tricarboxylate transporter TctB family protein [Proteobacteria bacterium]|nr:tripartite tricarboxylate transporter TctB family protein [Pseudomonadota bacterium]